MKYRLDTYVKDVLKQKLRGKKIKIKLTKNKVIEKERNKQSIDDISVMFYQNLFDVMRSPNDGHWYPKTIGEESEYNQENMLKLLHEYVKK